MLSILLEEVLTRGVGEEESVMGYLVFSPKMHMWKSQSPVFQNVKIFGDMVFKEVISLNEVIWVVPHPCDCR